MDTFTYIVTIFVLAFASQYHLVWLSLAILLFLLFTLRSLSGIFLTLATGAVFLILGNDLNGDILYASIILVILSYIVGIKPSEEQGGMNADMMAALQGMGGDPYGGLDFGGGGGGGHGGH